VAFRPDGKLMAAAGTDQSVAIREAATGKLLHTLRGHGRAVVHLAFSPDGTRLASAAGTTRPKYGTSPPAQSFLP